MDEGTDHRLHRQAGRCGARCARHGGSVSSLRCAGTRETDVEIRWPGGALLIEDKIDAAFTLEQPASYRVEVEERRKSGEDVRSVLVCPARRRVALEAEAAGAFDTVVTCEELAEVAEAAGPVAAGAAMVLRAAAAPPPLRAATPVDLVRSEWGDGYRRVLAEVVPAGSQLSPGAQSLRTATADWMSFRCAGIDGPEVWALAHWIPNGVVQIDLNTIDEVTDAPPGAKVIRKPVMTCVTLDVHPMTFDRPPEAQREEIADAAHAALRLRAWAAEARLRPRPPASK